ncbi:hypothetical protein SSS_01722 [Sarcoptes scabiei]|uniref:Uncharacterized protein n=2 Tax=Sarcoptes scabiei TaxID=52283 RepID=A0A834VBT3_SARSC|nr:hypothetical protein SSS_01722 [Sarcoptes scabiei]
MLERIIELLYARIERIEKREKETGYIFEDQDRNNKRPKCRNCNRIGHFAKDCRAPARERAGEYQTVPQNPNVSQQQTREKRCFKCGNSGHFANQCRTPTVGNVPVVERPASTVNNVITCPQAEPTPSTSRDANYSCITQPSQCPQAEPKPSTSRGANYICLTQPKQCQSNEPRMNGLVKINCVQNELFDDEVDQFRMNAYVNEKKIEFLLDTGSNMNMIPLEVAIREKLPISYLDQPFRFAVGGAHHATEMYCDIDTRIGNVTNLLRFFIVPTYDENILGRKNFKLFNLLAGQDGVYQQPEISKKITTENEENPAIDVDVVSQVWESDGSEVKRDPGAVEKDKSPEKTVVNLPLQDEFHQMCDEDYIELKTEIFDTNCDESDDEPLVIDRGDDTVKQNVLEENFLKNEVKYQSIIDQSVSEISIESGKMEDTTEQIFKMTSDKSNVIPFNCEKIDHLSVSVKNEFSESTVINFDEKVTNPTVSKEFPDDEKGKNRKCRNFKTTSNSKLYPIILMSAVTSLVFGNVSFRKHEPILWHRTFHNVIEHQNYNFIRLLMVSPCELLKQQNKSQTFIDICESEYQQEIKQAKDLCHNHIRRERALGFLGTFTTIIVAQSVLGLANLIFHRDSQTEQFEMLRAEQLKFSQQFREMEWKTVGIIKKMMHDQKRILNFVERKFEEALISEQFIADMTVKGRALDRFLQEARLGRVNPDFHFLFPNLLNETDGRTDQWEFVRCKITEMSNLYTKFEMEIVTPQISEDLTIWKAVPFDIYKLQGDKFCRFKYHGPKLVCHDHTTNCLRSIDSVNSDRRVFLNDIDDQCMKTTTKNMWELERCDFETIKIQLKYDENFAYVYCLGSRLEFEFFNITCDNYVYQIPRNVSFLTNGSSFEMSFKERIIEKIHHSYALNTSKINRHIFENQTNYDMELKELNDLIKATETSSFKFSSVGEHVAWKVLPVIIMTIMATATLILKFSSKKPTIVARLTNSDAQRGSLMTRLDRPQPGGLI